MSHDFVDDNVTLECQKAEISWNWQAYVEYSPNYGYKRKTIKKADTCGRAQVKQGQLIRLLTALVIFLLLW